MRATSSRTDNRAYRLASRNRPCRADLTAATIGQQSPLWLPLRLLGS
jgi:hypothetical protein